MKNTTTKKFETYDEIIAESRALVKHLEALYGFRFHGTRKGSYGEYFKVNDAEVEISFNTGRLNRNPASKMWNRYESEVASCTTDKDGKFEWTVIMSKKQLSQLVDEHFDHAVTTIYFNESTRWGVRIWLEATKAIGELWRANPKGLPAKIYVLRETNAMITWSYDLEKRQGGRTDFKTDVMNKEFFPTREAAIEATVVGLKRKIMDLEESIERSKEGIQWMARLVDQLEKAQQADSQ